MGRLLALALLVCVAADARAQGEPVAQARQMASSGRYAEAIQILRQRLAERPADTDARALFGVIMFEEGYDDDARRELEYVLGANPTHAEALPALVKVELRSYRLMRALALTQQGLTVKPDDVTLLILSGRVLDAMDRRKEARQQFDGALRVKPGNDEALRRRRALRPERLWSLGGTSGSDRYDDKTSPWRENSVHVGVATIAGTITAHGHRAERFGLQNDQLELEWAPSFRPGTSADVAVAYSQDKVLYPEYRVAFDLNQGIGAGFELSVGARQMAFSEDVRVYTGAISKYYGNWLFTGRAFVTPDSAGIQRSFHGSFRRTYGPGGGSAIGLRYARGSVRNDIRNLDDLDVLDSDTLNLEMESSIARWLGMSTRAAYGREKLERDPELWRLSVATGIFLRF
jgi:YaiO family outer membrane protein